MAAERQVSAKAKEISESKPKFWEYELTSILIRDWVGPIERKWNDLEGGLYILPKNRIGNDDFLVWLSDKMDEISGQTVALNKLINSKLTSAWGKPGEPGSVPEIERACSYIADACQRMLDWEESISAARVDEPFTDLLAISKGIIGSNIKNVLGISGFVDKMLSGDPKGEYRFNVVISLPDGFADEFSAAMARAQSHLGIGD